MKSKNKRKDSKIFTWVLENSSYLLTIISIIAVVGLFYSVFYEIEGYNISFLPDIGTPADFFGVLGTILTIFVTWQQIKKSDEKVHKDNEEARKKLQTSQEQFNKTIEEMQKEREEAYKPDLYMDIDIKEGNFVIYKFCPNVIGAEGKNFSIINVGSGTAKNIKVEAYSGRNIASLNKNINTSLSISGQKIMYAPSNMDKLEDNIDPIFDKYLFPKDKIKIPLPKIYLQILRDYVFKLGDEKKINEDPFSKLPKFTYIITYQDQEEIKYSKEVIISAKVSNNRSGGMTGILSVKNKPAEKA